MTTYQMACSCGNVMKIDAASRDEAVRKLQAMMTADAIQAHMTQKHPGEPALAQTQAHQMIAQNLKPA
jgi:hypothetical protein